MTNMKTFTPNDRAKFRPLTYLACPYSHPDPKVKDERCRKADRATAHLIDTKGWNVFSPITHSHPLAMCGLKGSWEFWQKIDIEYLLLSERVIVLCLDGWRESTGVNAEIDIAKQLGIPISYMLRIPEAGNFSQPFLATPCEEPMAVSGNFAGPADSTNPKDLLGVLKPQVNLVPSALILRVAKVMELGAKKYGPFNWRTKKVRLTVYAAAAMRHILQLLDGENTDAESNQTHAAHAAACMGILLDAEATGNLIDDRAMAGPAGKLISELTEKKSL
jgi:hypothetical protein